MKKNLISVYPDEKLSKEIKRRAKKENRSLNNYVLNLLKKEVIRDEQNR